MNIYYIITDMINSYILTFKDLTNPNISIYNKLANLFSATIIMILLLFSLYGIYNIIAQ